MRGNTNFPVVVVSLADEVAAERQVLPSVRSDAITGGAEKIKQSAWGWASSLEHPSPHGPVSPAWRGACSGPLKGLLHRFALIRLYEDPSPSGHRNRYLLSTWNLNPRCFVFSRRAGRFLRAGTSQARSRRR